MNYNSKHGNGRKSSGSGGSGSDGGGWRTYNQAKKSEFSTFKRKHFNRTKVPGAGYHHHDRKPLLVTPTPDQTGRDRDDFYMEILRRTPPPSLLPTPSKVPKKDDEVEVLEVVDNKEKQRSINLKKFGKSSSSQEKQKIISSRRGIKTGPEVFDPFKPIALMPAPSSSVVSQMYEDMLSTNIKPGSFQFTSYQFKDARESQKFAEMHSPGFFVTKMDSNHGNCLMPVLPRIDRK